MQNDFPSLWFWIIWYHTDRVFFMFVTFMNNISFSFLGNQKYILKKNVSTTSLVEYFGDLLYSAISINWAFFYGILSPCTRYLFLLNWQQCSTYTTNTESLHSMVLPKVKSYHSLYGTVKFTATFLKCVSSLDFSLRAAWAGHYALWREDCTALHSWRMTDIIGKLENSSFKVI